MEQVAILLWHASEGRVFDTSNDTVVVTRTLLRTSAEVIERLQATLKPLLDHYLNCYDGNKDALAIEAEKLLKSAVA